MNIDEFKKYLSDREYPRYERDSWDAFLAKTKFSFEIPAIHIAGSNGKGATLHYLKNIYMAAGYKVGTFYSPALYSLNEMIRINDKKIDDNSLINHFEKVKKLSEKYDLSSFEILTYIALDYFNEQKPDICIIECGMGGATDATNIFESILSIITSVSLEHTSALGRTVSEIALTKGGIIKEDKPVLVGKVPEDAEKVLKDIAHQNHSPYHFVSRYHFLEREESGFKFAYGDFLDLRLNTLASYQVENAAMAIEATLLLNDSFPVKKDDVYKGLLGLEPLLHLEKNGNIIFDGAHNPEAIETLSNELKYLETEKPIHVLFACFRDKNINVELPILGTYVKEIVLTTFDHKRARTKDEYFLYLDEFAFEDDWKAALEKLIEKYPDDYILVTGSIAFAALVRKYVLEK